MQNAGPDRNCISGYNVKGKPVVSLSGDYSYWVVSDQYRTSRQKRLVVVGNASTISCMEKMKSSHANILGLIQSRTFLTKCKHNILCEMFKHACLRY